MPWSKEFSGLQSRLLAYRNDKSKTTSKKEDKMSADNGWILRKNLQGEFVLTEYSASEDTFPSIDGPKSQVFPTLPQAIAWYEENAGSSEYGLTVKLKEKSNAFVGEYVNHHHVVVQHRDGKPPWCNVCKLTSDFRVPISRLDKEEKHSPKDISQKWDSVSDSSKMSERFVIVVEYNCDTSWYGASPIEVAAEQVRQRLHHPDQLNVKVVQVYAAIREDAQKVLEVFKSKNE